MLPNEGVHETLHLPSGSKNATEQKACRSVTTLPLSKFDLRSHSESPDIESLKVWDPRDLEQMSTKPVTHLLSELDSLPAPAGQASKKFHQRRPPAMQPQGNRQGNRIESHCNASQTQPGLHPESIRIKNPKRTLSSTKVIQNGFPRLQLTVTAQLCLAGKRCKRCLGLWRRCSAWSQRRNRLSAAMASVPRKSTFRGKGDQTEIRRTVS